MVTVTPLALKCAMARVHILDSKSQVMEAVAVLFPIVDVIVRTHRGLDPFERKISCPVPSEVHFKLPRLAAVHPVEADVVHDLKGAEPDVLPERADLAHVRNDETKMIDLVERVFVGAGSFAAARPVGIVGQLQSEASALGRRIQVGESSFFLLPFPGSRLHHAHAPALEILNLLVHNGRAGHLVSEVVHAIAVRGKKLVINAMPLDRLDPLDLDAAHVAKGHFHFQRRLFAAIGNVREVHDAGTTNVPEAQHLPVIHHRIQVLHHPAHLHDVAVKGMIHGGPGRLAGGG